MKYGHIKKLNDFKVDPAFSKSLSRKIITAVESGIHPDGIWGYSNFPGRRINPNASQYECIKIDKKNELSRIAAGNEIGDDKPWWYYFTGRRPYKNKKSWSLAYIRLWDKLDWYWNDEEITKDLIQLVKPVEHLFKKITRVSVIIQIQNLEVPVHRDLVPGYWYNDITSPTNPEPGQYKGYFRGRPHKVEAHKEVPNTNVGPQHGYMGMRIPLSTDDNAHVGNPYVFLANKKHYYDCQNNYFLLNESTLHGADRCPFERGVISVSGIYDLFELDNLPKEDPEFSTTRWV